MYFISLKPPKMEAALLWKIHLRILKEWRKKTDLNLRENRINKHKNYKLVKKKKEREKKNNAKWALEMLYSFSSYCKFKVNSKSQQASVSLFKFYEKKQHKKA